MADKLRQLAQRQHALDQEHLVVGDRRARAARSARSSAGIAASISSRITEPRRRRLSALSNSAHQVFRLFLDFDVGVADDAERALPLDRVAGKQPADEQAGRLLERDHAHRRRCRRAAAGG